MLTRAIAALTAASLAATPAAAVTLPGPAPASIDRGIGDVLDTAADTGIATAEAWRGGWRGHRHRDRVDAGDVLTGVLILGTIAAMANAASRASQRRAYPYPDRPYPDRPYPDRPYDYRADDTRDQHPRGLDSAADMCLREVERDARVREVTSVQRNAGGWYVTGSLASGAGFTCSIGSDGRIDRVDIGGQAQGYGAVPDRQYGEDVYRSARASADATSGTDDPAGARHDGPRPAYPGGPLPGEEPEEDAPGA